MSGLKKTLSGLSLVVAFSTILSCGSSNSNSQSSNNIYSGHWAGFEELPSGPGALNFQVQSNGTVFCFGFVDPNNLSGTLDTGCSDGVLESFPIAGSSFSLPMTTYNPGGNRGDSGTFSLTGQFTSSTQATGTVVVMSGNTPNTYNWTASRLQ
jgi:hypothetical protein